MEQGITYKFSKGVRQAKKRYATLSILLPIILIFSLFLSPITRDDSLATKAGIGLFAFVMLGLIFYFTASTALRKLSELSVSIFPDRFERDNRKQKESYFWKDLQRAEILEYPNGEVASLKLIFANRKVVALFGFEDMATATKEIEQEFPNEASVRRKRMKINWEQPIFMILSGLLALAVILAVQEIGERAYRFFNVLFFFSLGFYNLVFRPISQAQGKSWKIFETVMGVILIVCSVSLLVLELFPK
jgi:hypothetical protein